MLFIMGFSILLTKICIALGFGKDCFLCEQMRHVKFDSRLLCYNS